MTFPKPKKHVIFLGAGASVTSGYPDANRLAVLMCDTWTFTRELVSRLEAEGEQNAKQYILGKSTIRTYYDSFRKSAQLLRHGDFATMDELSNLAKGGQLASEIQNLKKLMRFVFALNNPDLTHWANSDYRAFIQAIFDGRGEPREDISIISFNYDPYFEWRLLRAQLARAVVKPLSHGAALRCRQAVTSGFIDPMDVEWLQTAGFCHLKLHGTCVLPTTQPIDRLGWPPQEGDPVHLTTEHMFRFDTLPRFCCLSNSTFASQAPPALLPWEIISPAGQLLEQAEFEVIVGPDWQHRALYPLFRALWQRARADIQAADKISFVGLSIGPFMEPELKFLFDGKSGIVEAVVANPEAAKYRDLPDPFHPVTFCGKMLDLFERICPGMYCDRSLRDDGAKPPEPRNETLPEGHPLTARQASRMTIRDGFSDFIRNEM